MAGLVCLLLLLTECAHSAVPYVPSGESWRDQQLSEPLSMAHDNNNLQENDPSFASVEMMALEECKEKVLAKGYQSVSPDCKERLRKTRESSLMFNFGKVSSQPHAMTKTEPQDFGMGSYQCGSSGPASSAPQFLKSQYFSQAQTNMDALEVLTLPIGQGDCTVIYCPGGKRAVLFDCGSSSHDDNKFSPEYVRRFFDNVQTITIIISHGHQDHYNYIPRVFSDELLLDKITKVYLGGDKRDYTGLRKFLYQLERKHEEKDSIVVPLLVRPNKTPSPLHMDICGNKAIHFSIIAAGMGTKKNEKSVVMKLHCDTCKSSLLFTGDMEGEAAEWLAANSDLSSTHYKVTHHGASNETPSNSKNWLEAIRAVEAHFSHSYDGRYGHPRCDTVDRLLDVKAKGTTDAGSHATRSIGTTLGVSHTFSCVVEKQKNKPGVMHKEEICDRMFSTYPDEGGMCVIKLTFLPGREATTTIFCDLIPKWNTEKSDVPIDDKEED